MNETGERVQAVAVGLLLAAIFSILCFLWHLLAPFLLIFLYALEPLL